MTKPKPKDQLKERRLIQKGEVMNPTGKNGQMKGWQRYGARAKILVERYTADEIKEIVNDKQKFGSLSMIDAILIRHLAGCLAGDDVRGERMDLVDRMDGKPQQPVEHTQRTAYDDMSTDDLLRLTNDIRRAIAAVPRGD